MKAVMLKHILNKMVKTSDRKSIKGSQRKRTYHVQRNKDKDDIRFLIGSNASEKTVKQCL